MKKTKGFFAVAPTLTVALSVAFTAADVFAQAGPLGAVRARAAARNAARTGAVVTEMETVAPPQTTAAPTSAPSARATAAPAKKSDGSEFVIPATATAEQLLAQADRLLTNETVFETEEEYVAWVDKMLATNAKIADRVLSMKTTDEVFLKAVSLKGQVLCYQASVDVAVLPKLKAYADALQKNKRVQSLEEGRDAALAFSGVYLQAAVADVVERGGTAQELKAAMKEVEAFVAAHPEAADMTTDLVVPVAILAATLEDPTLPNAVWAPILKNLKAAGDADSLRALEGLEGAIRFSELEGKTFQWFGRTADGKAFDPASVKGKVVLVDFWASWNESCADVQKELAKLYKAYNKSGFEIVGYNLDGDAKDMRAYLTKSPLAWPILTDLQAIAAKEKSLARYYGIEEVPTLILIGGDGKVAAVDVDLETLLATLKVVFPDVEAPTLGTAAATAAQPSAAATTGTARQTGAAATTGAARQTKTPATPGAAATGTRRAVGSAR
ncbi:MAG: TlpA family protein disulfide reductase [Thermoguttaceae bacterium]|nr:TlpA family protein disulfide reductase [Thermoguttaceae bacterium]